MLILFTVFLIFPCLISALCVIGWLAGGGGRWLAASWQPLGKSQAWVHAASAFLWEGRGDGGGIKVGWYSGITCVHGTHLTHARTHTHPQTRTHTRSQIEVQTPWKGQWPQTCFIFSPNQLSLLLQHYCTKNPSLNEGYEVCCISEAIFLQLLEMFFIPWSQSINVIKCPDIKI